ncbi:reverse transcriptase domain-containing protein, partial [Tanacetum coccineum]
MLKRCEDTNLSLNWEKSHFMVKKGIEVDRAKVEVIAKLSHPTTVKGVRSFLGHAGFYRRFIQDFSKIARPMTHLLEKETPFVFSEECIDSFNTLKRKLTEAPILIAPDWDLPFELMCDASDFAIGAVLGQRKNKHFQPIHYASKTMNEAQTHYTTTEKELLAVVYAFEKFRSYLVMSKSIVVRQPNAFTSERPRMSRPRFTSQVDEKNDLSKIVTPYYLPKVRESAAAKPHQVNAPNYSRNSHKESYGSNDMVHAYFLENARKITQDKTRIPNHRDMASTRAHCTPISKCSGGMSNGVPL